MDKGRMMELLGLNLKAVDTAVPRSFLEVMLDSKVPRAEFWFAWYQNAPIHLGEEFVIMMDATKVMLTDGSEVSLMALIETIIAHPEEVKITIK
jgi:hypothetical protein